MAILVYPSSRLTYLDGPWEKRDFWLVTGDSLPPISNQLVSG